ncbi:hypothetical protein [Streptomyces sulphureus]|uniref:hypothetical protein n=1 Tax=Streptomyces sulphureus TaxID=47758 RepID=UPI0003657ECE|nr:hypothetical protein [Streptomyces sulphureus]
MSAMQTAHSAPLQLASLAKELDETKVTPGVLGFLVFAVIGLAVWLLMKSMTTHMRRVDFEEQPAGSTPSPGAPGGSAAARRTAPEASPKTDT